MYPSMARSKEHLYISVLFIVTSVSLYVRQVAHRSKRELSTCPATGNPVTTGWLRSHCTSKYDSELYLNCNSWDCNYAILNSKHRVEGYMSLSTIWYHHFKVLSNYKIHQKRKRFVKRVGKLAKFVILLQDAHEGGSAAVASGQSWSWTCSYQSMAPLVPSFWPKLRPLEWDDSRYGNSGKRE